MKVSEKKEFVGEFYLPSNPGYKIPGVLKIGLNGEVQLETSGNFKPLPMNSNQWGLPLINGDVADVGCVTLLDCRYKSLTYGGHAKTTPIAVRCALCGLDTVYENEDEIKFDSIRFSVEHLNRWLGFVGVKQTGHPVEGMTIDYVLPKAAPIKLGDRIEARFAFDACWNAFHADGIKIDQYARIEIASERSRSLSYWVDLIDKINAFLCMATDEIVCIKDVAVPKNGNRATVQIYYQPFIRTEESRKWDTTYSLCRFFDIAENFPAILNRWVETHELTRPTYFLYLSCKMDGVKYIENMFLTLVQALENLHEAGRTLYDNWPDNKGKNLKQKLNNLVFTFKDFIPDGQVAMWNEVIEDVAGVRNHLTHYSKTAPEFKKKSENPEIVYCLYKKLEVVIQLHFLKQIGFNNREIENHLKTIAFGLESVFHMPYRGG